MVDADVIEFEALCRPEFDLTVLWSSRSEGSVGSGGATANAGIVECRTCGRGSSIGVRSPPSSVCGKLNSPPIGTGNGNGISGSALLEVAGVCLPAERLEDKEVSVLRGDPRSSLPESRIILRLVPGLELSR